MSSGETDELSLSASSCSTAERYTPGQFVWVRVGKTDHHALIVEAGTPMPGKCRVKWCSTLDVEEVDVTAVSPGLAPRKRDRRQAASAAAASASATHAVAEGDEGDAQGKGTRRTRRKDPPPSVVISSIRSPRLGLSHEAEAEACYGSVLVALKIQPSAADESRADLTSEDSAEHHVFQRPTGSNVHNFQDILDHVYNGKQYYFQVKWTNGDISQEPMENLRKDAPYELASYLRRSGLASSRRTCQWANDAEFLSEDEDSCEGSDDPGEEEGPFCPDHEDYVSNRKYELRSNSKHKDMDTEDEGQTEDEGLTEEQVFYKQRRKRELMFDESRRERRVRRKAWVSHQLTQVAVELASECAKYTKVPDNDGLFSMLGQLGNDSNFGSFNQSSEDKLFQCPCCLGQFDSSIAGMKYKRDSNLPVLSAVCCHRVCCRCLTHMQLAEERSISPKWLKCPICKQNTAFNAIDMPVDLYICECMKRIESKTYVLSAAIDLSSKEHLKLTRLYSRSKRSLARKSEDLDAALDELNSTKKKLFRTRRLLKKLQDQESRTKRSNAKSVLETIVDK